MAWPFGRLVDLPSQSRRSPCVTNGKLKCRSTSSSRSAASRSSMNARLLARENISLAVNVSSQSVQGFPVILDASNPPSFWIIGAQKGGTSVMNHWLQSLPNIAMRPNELHFFDRAAWNCSFRVCTSFYMNESRFYQNFRHILPPDPSLPYGAKAPSYLYIPVVPRAVSRLCKCVVSTVCVGSCCVPRCATAFLAGLYI